MGVVSWAQHSSRVFRFEEDPWGRPTVNQHSTVSHFPRPTVTHLQEGDRWGGAAAGPARRDDPSQSFPCKSSLVAFPSLPDEKKLL